MSALAAAIHAHALCAPDSTALSDGRESLNYRQLDSRSTALAARWRDSGVKVLGLLADNGIPWVMADLAALMAGVPLVPLPVFFSPAQMLHAMADSGMDGLLTDRPTQALAMILAAGIEAGIDASIDAGTEGLSLIRISYGHRLGTALPKTCAKITYTSGTTAAPKGVCLSRGHIETVMASLHAATGADNADRHLCLTPLSTLLENIGGVYVPLLAGASCHALPLAQVGLSGASGLDAARMVAALCDVDASSAIMVPQMLQAMLRVIEASAIATPKLRFLAVGGAPVSSRLLDQARELGVPVYEGYGLSECASVVALNSPGDARPGSLGRPLPHLRLSFSDAGEILVAGSNFLGYLGDGAVAEPWPTGDLGYLDRDGFLHLRGRKKSMFITSFGRNIAPEWVEGELACNAAIAQAAVFGEARPFNVAVITPAIGAENSAVRDAVLEANARLPDYARIRHWICAPQPFAPGNQQLTANGRLKRDAIWSEYQAAIEKLYQEDTNVVF